MRFCVRMGIGLLGLGALLGAPVWGADHDSLDRAASKVNSAATTSPGSQQVAGKIASELNAACACTNFSASSVTAQRAQTGWGWGELLIADLLAVSISQQSNTPLATAMGQVAAARQGGAGWGAIAKANGLNVGDLVSGAVKSANAVSSAASDAKGKGQDIGPGVGKGSGKGGGKEAGGGADHGAAAADGGRGGGSGSGGGQGGGGQGGGGGGAGGGGGGAGGGGGGGGKK